MNAVRVVFWMWLAIIVASVLPSPRVAAQDAAPEAAQQAAAPAPAQPLTFKPEEIEAIVAPIALYPDELLAQIFMASTYPLEVVEAARWSKDNPKVTGKALEDAMQPGCAERYARRAACRTGGWSSS